MANTYIKLQSASVEAGGSTEITFNNIPQTYTDLKIVVSSRRSAGNVWGTYVLTLNSNSNSIYSWRELKGDGASGSAVESLNTTSIKVSEGVGSGSGANIFDNTEIDILSYASNVNYKQINSHGAGENNATTAYQGLWVGRWLSYDPVTSVTIKSGSETFVQHTSITLYGIFNADVSSAPATPTIGTASQSAAGSSASVAFTGVSNAASYTATSTPGSFTGTGTTSPVTVTGLTDGTAYTFTVKSNNPFGSSSNSSASGSVTSTTFAAYWAGGKVSGTTIQQLKFFAETRSNLSATLSSSTSYAQGLANSGVNGYFAGGQDSAEISTVRKLNFGTLTLSTTTALPATRSQSMNGYSNSGTAGYIPGGSGGSNSIAKIAYSNDATSTISATLPTGVARGSGCANSPTAGYSFGGTPGPISSIQKLAFSGETTSTLSATLPFAIYTSTAASNNGTAGYVFGGYPPFYKTIKKLTYSGETVSTIGATMTYDDYAADAAVGSWSGNAAFVGAGYNGGTGTGNEIGKLTYSSETWSNLSATLTSNNNEDPGSCSNSGVL
jgi:hypothetical protein